MSSSLHVAIALWAFCRVIALQQGVSVSVSTQCAVFGFGWAAYQYSHNFVPVLYKKQMVSIGNILLFGVAVAIGFWGLMVLSTHVWMVFVGVGVLTFCYALPFGAKMGLRFVSMLKVFVVAVSWSAMAMMGLIGLPKQLFMLIAVKSIFWILCLMLPFELRDLHKDAPNLKTIPQVLGISGTKKLGYVLLCGIVFLAYQTVQETALFWMEITMLFLLGVAIKLSPKQTTLFTSFWVEGIPVLWFLGSVLTLILY